jgi:rhodanese-related sulfurtransferase
MTALAVPTETSVAPRIGVAVLHTLLGERGEIALLDVREEYDYAGGHILLATSLPLSRLELRILDLVPRQATPIVICDGGDGSLAARAAETLRTLGYGDVRVLAGGVAAWRTHGHPLFTTTHVLAKTFGGVAERAYRVPRITAWDLKARLAAGADVAIFDARTFAEFQAGSLPGAASCPLAELPHRVPSAVPSRDTLVVINCASRTRGILGAQSLRHIGLANPIAVLENGVMAWSLAGGAVTEGSDRIAPPPPDDSLAERRKTAAALAARFAIPLIGQEVLQRFGQDTGRTLYLFDVRTPEAFAASHPDSARSAPGGQLIMTLPQFAATHGARIVLLDGGDGLSAVTTAVWLKQIARHEVFVLINPDAAGAAVTGPEPSVGASPTDAIPSIGVAEAAALIDTGDAVVIDVETSLAYRQGHIPAARFAIRARLPAGLEAINGDKTIIVTSSDGTLAALAAHDLLPHRRAVALTGGTNAWAAAGRPLATGDGDPLHPFEDLWPSPMRATEHKLAAFADYLRWEVSLADAVAADSTIAFDIPAGS